MKPRVNELAAIGLPATPKLYWVDIQKLRNYGLTPEDRINNFCEQEGYKRSGHIIFDDAAYLLIRLAG